MPEINYREENYPKLLRQISDFPKMIYSLGNMELLNYEKIIAVVGSRKMSQYGNEAVEWLVPQLVKSGWVIVSGMAFGVDAQVQDCCIKNGGKTIAVLASGANVISPKSNKWLYDKILENKGLIISEQGWGKEPKREFFLKRNRIVTGLSLGVIVVEGGCRSGTLVTAKLALEQGREVWCIPGRIFDENSYCPNFLISNGANLLNNIEDIETMAAKRQLDMHELVGDNF
ncbi:MAG TPA: DNA-processing protein DprA [Patescibacteria group bacterium]